MNIREIRKISIAERETGENIENKGRSNYFNYWSTWNYDPYIRKGGFSRFQQQCQRSMSGLYLERPCCDTFPRWEKLVEKFE